MDYKTILILLVVLFLIILVYREITSLRENINNDIETTFIVAKNENARQEALLQHNMDNYLNQIKTISTDNLHQLKKITLLNHQPIINKKVSNHFTETDGTESHINYLSDTKNKSHHKSQYYMSEETKNKQSDCDTNYAEQSPSKSSKSTKSTKSSKSNKSNKNSIPIYEESGTISNDSSSTGLDYDEPQCDKDFCEIENYKQKVESNVVDNYDITNVVTIVDDNVEIIEQNKDNIEINNENINIETIESNNDDMNIILNIGNNNNIVIEGEQLKELKSQNEYTLNELKALAKQYGIPTTYKHQNKTQQYKKDELYNNIKLNINQK